MISIHEANDWDNLLSFSATISSSAAQVAVAAAVPGVKYVVLAITVTNSSAVLTTFEVQSASTRLWRVNLPVTSGMFSVSNPGGLVQTVANEALNVQCSSATSVVDFNISYLRVASAP